MHQLSVDAVEVHVLEHALGIAGVRRPVEVSVPRHRPTLEAGGPDADRALAEALGRPARLERVPAGSTLDAPVHLVSRQALDAAARGEHDAADCACSLEEPRANLVLDVPGLREEDWIGRRLGIGAAVLRVARRPGHCLGVYAEVARAGTIRPGDAVVLRSSAEEPALGLG